MAAHTPLADVSEKQWQTQVLTITRTLGYRHYHTYRSTKSPAGWPDLALVRERLVLLELKTETGRVSDRQASWLAALADAGVEVYVARPRHLDPLASVLSARGTVDRWTAAQREARAVLLAELDRVLNPQTKEKAA